MRKSTVIALFSILMALSLTGCDSGNRLKPGTREGGVLVSIRAGNLFTEYLYDDYGARIGTVQSDAGAPVYEESDFKYGSDGDSFICTRTYADPEKPAERRTTTYRFFYDQSGYNVVMQEKDGTVFTLDENGNPTSDIPSEEWTREFDTYGNLTGYERKENGVVMITQTNFIFNFAEGYMTFNMIEGDAAAVKMYHRLTTGGYELYRGYVDNNNKGTLVEKKTNHNINGSTETYKMTVYDNDGGNPVETEYTIQSEVRVFKVR